MDLPHPYANPDPQEEMAWCMRHFRGDRFLAWLRESDSKGHGHGFDLHFRLAGPMAWGDREGMPDAGPAVERLLCAGMGLGFLKPSNRPIPTKQQQFMGIGGMDAAASGSPLSYGYYVTIATPWAWLESLAKEAA